MPDTRVATLTIASGAAISNVLTLNDGAALRVWTAVVYAPATLPEAVTVEVSADEVTWDTLRANGEDVALAAGKADPLIGLACHALRLKAGANVAADRVFTVHAV